MRGKRFQVPESSVPAFLTLKRQGPTTVFSQSGLSSAAEGQFSEAVDLDTARLRHLQVADCITEMPSWMDWFQYCA